MISRIITKFKNFFKIAVRCIIIIFIVHHIYLMWKTNFLEDKNRYLTLSSETNIDCKKLKAKNKILKEEIEVLQNQISSKEKSKTEQILDDIFWDYGIYHLDADFKKVKFYKDEDCKIFCKPKIFTSKRWVEYDQDNSYMVYLYRSAEGYVFSPEKVSFH